MKKYIFLAIAALASLTNPILAADPLPTPSIDAPLEATTLDEMIDLKACLEDCKDFTSKVKLVSSNEPYKDWTFEGNKKFADLTPLEQGAIKLHTVELKLKDVLLARYTLLRIKTKFDKLPNNEQKTKDAKRLEDAQTKWMDAHKEVETQHKKIIADMIANNKDPKLAVELKSYQSRVEELYKDKK